MRLIGDIRQRSKEPLSLVLAGDGRKCRSTNDYLIKESAFLYAFCYVQTVSCLSLLKALNDCALGLFRSSFWCKDRQKLKFIVG